MADRQKRFEKLLVDADFFENGRKELKSSVFKNIRIRDGVNGASGSGDLGGRVHASPETCVKTSVPRN